MNEYHHYEKLTTSRQIICGRRKDRNKKMQLKRSKRTTNEEDKKDCICTVYVALIENKNCSEKIESEIDSFSTILIHKLIETVAEIPIEYHFAVTFAHSAIIIGSVIIIG